MTSLLLSILETKEKIRNERFAEISRLLDELRSGFPSLRSDHSADVTIYRRKTSTQSEVCVSILDTLIRGTEY